MLRRILALQLDPYTLTPLWPDTVSLAALQARVGLDAGLWDEQAMAEVADRSRTDAEKNQYAVRKGGSSVEELLARPMYADPLRKHDCAPVTDGAAAIVLAAGDRARDAVERPGLDHRDRALRRPAPARRARPDPRAVGRAGPAARSASAGVEVAELHAPFTHQELILRAELGLGDDVRINPSGGALAGNPMFTAGLIRIGEAARRIWDGGAGRVLGHATSGPALQQNLVCVMERQADSERWASSRPP